MLQFGPCEPRALGLHSSEFLVTFCFPLWWFQLSTLHDELFHTSSFQSETTLSYISIKIGYFAIPQKKKKKKNPGLLFIVDFPFKELSQKTEVFQAVKSERPVM